MTSTQPTATLGGPAEAGRLTLGVEEEFLLLDPATGVNMPVAEAVVEALPANARRQSRLEFRRSMLEMVTPVLTDLTELGRTLTALRWDAAQAAAGVGAHLVAIGATPVGEPTPAVPRQARYEAMVRRFGPLAMDPAVCGCHVHVGVPDRELAVQVCTRLRVWLPVVQALTANSPIHAGTDTGHASWRCVQFERWPSLGPTPEFESADDYDRVVESLVDAGIALDPTIACWYARPSVAYPTVEIRVGDVCSTTAEAVLVAGIIRALVATLLDEARAGVPATRVRDCLLLAAHWRAAHDGLDGSLVDLRTGRKRPAWDLVDELIDTIMSALVRHGDVDLVTTHLATLRSVGNGAARQRELLSRDGIPSMLGTLADRTLLPWHSQDWSSTQRVRLPRY